MTVIDNASDNHWMIGYRKRGQKAKSAMLEPAALVFSKR
jgi:hypothetical protein